MTSLSSNDRLRLSNEKAKDWLNSVNPEEYDDLESVVSSMVDSSIIDSSDSESGEEQHLGIRTKGSAADVTNFNKPEKYTDITELPTYNQVLNTDCIRNQLEHLAPTPTYSNVSISNSTNVRLGNVIKIKGNLNINVINNNNETEEDQQSTKNVAQHKSDNAIYRPACLIISRKRWLAMDPLNESNSIKQPVDFVIISHTATASSTDQPGNIGIIRDMQTLHIETEGRNDIIYNFLIGCDGNVYEGRGWSIEGDHTPGYNNKSIGITFVGSFMRKLPTERALKACKNLLIRGVIEENLSKDFKLLAQCQCSSYDSTGTKLYEEIQKWENFYDKNKEELIQVKEND